MALDQTPGVVVTLQRDEARDLWTRSYGLRVPAADVGPNTQPYVDGSVAADVVAPLFNDAVTIGRGTTLRTSAGSWLRIIGEDDGVFTRPAVGASGFLGITTSAGGSMIQAGTVVLTKLGSVRYQVTTTALYTTATPVPITGIDTGPSTNADPGTLMTFQAPPPGCSGDAVVIADSDGNGLTGGRNADDDATYRQLISDARANPPASGNDAELQALVKATPGISVQQVFTYPAILTPGTTAYTFTLNPARPGGSRVPNGAQLAATLAYVVGQLPADDGIFTCTLTESPVRVCLEVSWAPGAANWIDVTQWPQYLTSDPVRVAASPVPTLTSFRLFSGTSGATPVAGQTIGFYDPTSGLFKRIRIGAVAVVTPNFAWDITPDRSYGASDPSFIPAVAAVASPWSDSLNLVAPAVISYFDGLGAGEQVSPPPDPGMRQRRQPQSPLRWPNVLDTRVLIPIFAVTAVEGVRPLEPSFSFATPTGTPAVLSYLLTLGNLGLFP